MWSPSEKVPSISSMSVNNSSLVSVKYTLCSLSIIMNPTDNKTKEIDAQKYIAIGNTPDFKLIWTPQFIPVIMAIPMNVEYSFDNFCWGNRKFDIFRFHLSQSTVLIAFSLSPSGVGKSILISLLIETDDDSLEATKATS